jgi:hypothetical protein
MGHGVMWGARRHTHGVRTCTLGMHWLIHASREKEEKKTRVHEYKYC